MADNFFDLKSGSTFTILTDLHTLRSDYEISDIKESYRYLLSSLPIYITLEKIDDFTCQEIFSRTVFTLKEGYNFVSEESGVYFNYYETQNISIKSFNDKKSETVSLKDIFMTIYFFDSCKELQLRDNEYISTLIYEALKQGKKFTRESIYNRMYKNELGIIDCDLDDSSKRNRKKLVKD